MNSANPATYERYRRQARKTGPQLVDRGGADLIFSLFEAFRVPVPTFPLDISVPVDELHKTGGSPRPNHETPMKGGYARPSL